MVDVISAAASCGVLPPLRLLFKLKFGLGRTNAGFGVAAETATLSSPPVDGVVDVGDALPRVPNLDLVPPILG